MINLSNTSAPLAWRAVDGRGRPELFHYDPGTTFPHLQHVQPLYGSPFHSLNQNDLTLRILVELGKQADRVLKAKQELASHIDMQGALQAELRQQETDLEDKLYELNELGIKS